MGVAQAILAVVGAYALIGIVFACAFVLRGAARIDHAAAAAPWSFKLLIFPGAAALWPLLAMKWLRASHTPHSTHQPRSHP
jgi:hypothetical protein